MLLLIMKKVYNRKNKILFDNNVDYINIRKSELIDNKNGDLPIRICVK
jgi:hypothetical protein